MNRQFGALSGIAIIAIILNHSIEMIRIPPENLGIPPLSGWQHFFLTIMQSPGIFGVPIFLFISGSFIAYAASGDPPKLSLKFLWASFKHILIPYILWSLIFYAYFYLRHNQVDTIFGYIKNMLVGYPFHFIPLLIFFYLMSPILVRFGKSYGTLLITIIAAYQLFHLIVLNPGILGFEFPGQAYLLTLPVLRTTFADWGIFFPLGLVYSIHTKNWLSELNRFKWAILLLTAIFYILAVMSEIFKVINFPISHYISTVLLIFLVPLIKRNKIPSVRFFEKVGKNSYGLYLANLIAIDIILWLIQTFTGWLYNYPILIALLVFSLVLILLIAITDLPIRGPTKQYHRFIFG